MKKKLAAFLLSFVMLAATFSTAFASNPTVIATSDKAVARPGDTIVVSVSLADNPGIAGFELLLNYDSTQLELTSITPDAVLGEMYSITANKIVWLHMGSDSTYNGKIMTALFTVRDTAQEGSVIISPSGTFSNYAVHPVIFTPVSVEIEVNEPAKPLLPDLDGDGQVSDYDLALLVRHVAKIECITDSDFLAAADVDPNGVIDAADVTALALFLSQP